MNRQTGAGSLLLSGAMPAGEPEPGLRSCVAADAYRRTGSHSLRPALHLFLRERTFRPLVTYRLSRACRDPVSSILVRLLHAAFCHLAAMDFPTRVQAGPGLALIHGRGMVLSGGATIGANVTIFHNVTIGQGDRIAADGSRAIGYPTIQDEVWIGPGATVVGGVTVGTASRIMPGAVVTFDVPAGSVVAGNPGKIVRSDCVPDVLNKAPLTAGGMPLQGRREAGASL